MLERLYPSKLKEDVMESNLTRQQKSCKSLWLQLAYICLIWNENNANISILDIQNYAHLVVYTHETFGPMTVNWGAIYQTFSMWKQYFKQKCDSSIT